MMRVKSPLLFKNFDVSPVRNCCGGTRFSSETYLSKLHSKTYRPNRNKPLITIVIVVYNAHEYLESSIKSVLSQEYSNIELIVVDGQSMLALTLSKNMSFVLIFGSVSQTRHLMP